MVETPPRQCFTVGEVERLLNLGFFEGERYELIDGDLLIKHSQSPLHAYSIRHGVAALMRVYPAERVLCQMPVQAAGDDAEFSLPEPDLGVLRECKTEHARKHPKGNELLLAAEVSDTTVAFDRSRKGPLYAHAGIPEYWVLDLSHRVLLVHRKPGGNGFRQIEMYSFEESVQFPGCPESIQVASLLPRPEARSS